MLVQKTLGKVEKLLGGDAIEDRWYEATIYRFTLEKEVTDLNFIGHGFERRNDGDVVVYKLTDDGWARATVYPIDGSDMALKAVVGSSNGFEDVCRVSGVEDVNKEVIGRTEWDIKVDVAEGTIVDVISEDYTDGVGESERMKKHLNEKR